MREALTELLTGARAALTAPNHGINEALAAEILERIDRFEARLARARASKRSNPDEIAWHALQLGAHLGDPMIEKYFQMVDGPRDSATKRHQKEKPLREARDAELKRFVADLLRAGYSRGNLLTRVVAKYGPDSNHAYPLAEATITRRVADIIKALKAGE
jgi:hypothetical protein